jgi:hypothetical protein
LTGWCLSTVDIFWKRRRFERQNRGGGGDVPNPRILTAATDLAQTLTLNHNLPADDDDDHLS